MKKIFLFLILISTVVIHLSYADTLKPAVVHAAGGDNHAGETANALEGTVVETMNSRGYSYVLIEKNGKKTWIAVPEMDISVGDEASFAPGAVMNNFTSKTLNRTFESIVFSSGPSAAVPHGSVSSGHFSGSGSEAPPEKITVLKAGGPDAYTVAELHEKRKELNGKQITLRGQVVKVSSEILDKYWIHLQDGSGDFSKGTDDIVVTSQDLPSVGDVITIKGTLYRDRDFGYGYKYSVIVEEAFISE